MPIDALIVMIIATVLIWGGLIISIIHLIKHPDIDESLVDDALFSEAQ